MGIPAVLQTSSHHSWVLHQWPPIRSHIRQRMLNTCNSCTRWSMVIHGDSLWSRIQGVVVCRLQIPVSIHWISQECKCKGRMAIDVCPMWTGGGGNSSSSSVSVSSSPNKDFLTWRCTGRLNQIRCLYLINPGEQNLHSPCPWHSPALLHWTSLAQLPHHLRVSNEVVASICGRITSLSTMNILRCKECLLSPFSLVPAS